MNQQAACKVGFVGIGNMGWPMAACVARSGFDLKVLDADAGAERRFAQEYGAAPAQAPADLADRDVIVTMLPTGRIVREVLTAGGDASLVARLRPGAVIVDMSSSEPQGTRDLARQLADRDITLVDAPVSGGVWRARTGTLAIMIGADNPAAVETVRPVLRAMGEQLFAVGSAGCGHALKALNNYASAAAFAAAAEALLIGERFGLDQGVMVEVMNASTGRSFHTDVVLREHVVDGKFGTGFAVGLLAKDLKIAADLGKAVERVSPVLDLVAERCAAARDALGPTHDFTEQYLAWKS